MDTQNTPVHIRLWHRDFWMLSLANLFMSSMVYMFIPILPSYLLSVQGWSMDEVGMLFLCYAVGLFVLGGFTSYLVQRYRRNVVCMLSILALTLAVGTMYFGEEVRVAHSLMVAIVSVVSLTMGALMGLAKMTLMSTLVIDSCESFMRTEANYISSWLGRISLAVGPVIGLICKDLINFRSIVVVGCVMGLCSVFFVRSAKFPFKAPDDTVKLFSTDRFFLVQGIPLFLMLAMVTASASMVLALELRVEFFGYMLLGFVLSIVSEKIVFSDADLKSEPITGLICMLLSLVMLLISRLPIVANVVPVMFSFGVGIIATRFMLFLIKLSRHCQRGTSQSTYFLGWEFGISVGLAAAYGLLQLNSVATYTVALGLVVLVITIYNFYLHPWYMNHKNR